MEHTKKMVVIPQEVFNRLQANVVDKNPQTNLSSETSLDAEMQKIMNNKSMDDSEKWKIYKQALQRFLHIAEHNRQPISIPIVETGDSRRMFTNVEGGPVEEIVETFSKTYRTNARNILRFMKRDGSLISWDSEYSVYVNGVKIKDSNLVDILNCIVKVRVRDYKPPGWVEVLNALKAMNVPKDYITNIRALKVLNAEYRATYTRGGGSDEEGEGEGEEEDARSSTESLLRTPLRDRLRSGRGKLATSTPVKAAAAASEFSFLNRTDPISHLDKWEPYKG